ncbi:SDR family NAD(P)-dependent oxidoreductase [Aspergillus fischeri NRRL 181]|uniref:Short chain dehydrogenase/reductase family oxidoreductase, putative n=1 Tax=Neosartorya fischeri (strain ATCC 1020 / DSM 3700 / CBS 544.65 / FGSC A1164 / JCM 1740 / NRRL 181 / WB 181) TaxID=331117 RepID=A1DCH2_NEOFI|nr:short chain dehydrogenase/reductase family oxidoreductase, putative [Aspergillus fischeri NRRL 181]EAW19532.1 short chain dehydrogenase/reductase family oxidoreductase, putative [Aspergillus fischeri NRRL 181]
MSLQGKIAIVTGASRGIGAGIALDLAKQGAKVKQAINELCDQIHSLDNGSAAIKVQADLRQPDAPARMLTATFDAFPNANNKIDILVNNAGVSLCKNLLETTDHDISSVFDINVYGLMSMTRAVIPHLRAPGRIINLSSVAARRGSPGFSVYSASKAAVEGFTRSLACELGPVECTVNAVQPGAVESDMLRREVPEQVIAYIQENTPLGNRIAIPEDIARVVTFLAGEGARWVTGQSICVSGGLHMN